MGEYAVKIVPVGDDRTWLSKHLKEVHVLERLRHPNIVEYKHTWIEYYRLSKFGPQVPCLFVLMEYANGGSLEEYVNLEVMDETRSAAHRGQTQHRPVYLDEAEILRIFLAAAKGLQHLHSLGIIHRDIKPANLLLNYPRDTVTSPSILLTDFGECAESGEHTAGRTGATGTIEFVAPELFVTDRENGYVHGHSVQTDIWSLGMVLYYLFFSGLPYTNFDDVDALMAEMLALERVEIPMVRSMSGPMRQLIEGLLSLDPVRRPKLPDIIRIVETVQIMNQTPQMPFTSPALRAIGSIGEGRSRRHSSLHRWDPSAALSVLSYGMLAALYARCYPCMPSIPVLAITVLALLFDKTRASKSIKAATMVTIAVLAAHAVHTRWCSC